MTSILADENIPRASIRLLRETGLDVRSAAEEMPGAPDTDILDLALSEERFLLTFDRDFGELIYHRRHKAPPGVVYLRLVPATPDEAALIFLNLLQLGEIKLAGRFTIVTRDQVRQRPLP